ncbi:MAG: peptidoglycan DD-metalloendopeptidase family protein [Pseudomonadota bacterium]
MRSLPLLLVLALPVQAQTAQEIARAAADQLERAASRLDAAEGASNRVAALTATVRAYEDGLSALRDGLRQVAVRQRALEDDLAARDAEIGRLIAALQGMEQSASPLLLLHPSGPLGTARSAMMLTEVTPALQREAEVLRADLQRLKDLRALEEAAATSLEEGLAGIQEARAILSDAIADRGPLPGRLAEDEARMADLLARVDTLEAFARGLGTLPALLGGQAIERPLPRPVDGTLLRRFQEADAAGIARPGLVLATYGGALVTAPTAGTVRYAGPLLDYGNVIILEPEPETLLVFAGLSEIYARAGEILEVDTPLGLMGGASPDATDFLRQPRAGGGASRPETLYIEVRQAGRPVDPAGWFADE